MYRALDGHEMADKYAIEKLNIKLNKCIKCIKNKMYNLREFVQVMLFIFGACTLCYKKEL